jgi:hypothetical protein
MASYITELRMKCYHSTKKDIISYIRWDKGRLQKYIKYMNQALKIKKKKCTRLEKRGRQRRIRENRNLWNRGTSTEQRRFGSLFFLTVINGANKYLKLFFSTFKHKLN